MKKLLFILALTASSAAQAHEIKAGNLVIHHPWIKQPVASSSMASGYTTIDNTGAQDDVLLKVTISGFPTVQIHQMKIQGDVMQMAEVQGGYVIPAGKSVELKPKSDHIMLMGLKSGLMIGDLLEGTLTFAKAGTVEVEFEVMPPNAEPNGHHGG